MVIDRANRGTGSVSLALWQPTPDPSPLARSSINCQRLPEPVERIPSGRAGGVLASTVIDVPVRGHLIFPSSLREAD